MMQAELLGRSELFDSLAVYLNNKNRLQPIIGLGSITECVQTKARDREVVYLCEVCVCRLSKADMRNHIMGSLHRYNYIKARHAHLACEWEGNSDLSDLAWPLMEMAKKVEAKEGPGHVQIMEVEAVLHQKIATLREHIAVTVINYIRDWQRALQTIAPPPQPHPGQSQRLVLQPEIEETQQQQQQEQDDGSPQWTQTNGPAPPGVESEKWSEDVPAANTGLTTSPQRTESSFQNPKLTVRGLGDDATWKQGAARSQRSDSGKWKPKRAARTLFKVSLPLTKGSVLLARTPFSKDALLPSHSPPPASDLNAGWSEDVNGEEAVEEAEAERHVTVTDYFSGDRSEYAADGKEDFFKDGLWDYGEEVHPEGPPSHGQDWSWLAGSTHETDSYADRWHGSSSQSFHRQAPRSRYAATPCLDAARVHSSPQLGHVALGTRAPSHAQMEFTTTSSNNSGSVPVFGPQGYMTRPAGYQDVGVMMSYPSYWTGKERRPDCYYPRSSSSYWGEAFRSNTDVHPVPSLYDANHFVVHSRNAALSKVDEFQGWR